MLLEKFKTAKQPEIQALRQLEYINMLPLPLRIERPSFLNALCAPNGNRPHVIAEFKRASPSRGDILMDFPPEEAAKQYAEAGASCLSVLTEETYFKGTLGYLKRMSAPGLPLLRKDFIFDRLQVAATAATPASALLLIVRLTPDAALLRSLREQAEAHGIDAVVEIFDEADLALARESGARIIQVNARDLIRCKWIAPPASVLRSGSIRPGTTKHGLRRAASPLRIISVRPPAPATRPCLSGPASWTAARPARR